MEPPPAPAAAKRAVCGRCQRPPRTCYCAALPPTALRTRRARVVVLQHAREQRQRQAISSVPVLTQVLAVPSSALVVPLAMEPTAPDTSVADALCETLRGQLDGVVLADAVERVFVLFPHAEAKTLSAELAMGVDTEQQVISQEEAQEEVDEKPVVLVVVDGTWPEAKKIVHHSRAYWERVAGDLRARRRVFEFVCVDAQGEDDSDHVSPSAVSQQGSIYGELRKEPMEGCVSTLEAVAMALRVLEPPPHDVCDALLSAFRAMVAIQSEFQQRGKAAQQARHGGTPKPSGGPSRPSSTGEQNEVVEPPREASRGVVKRYVFYTTHTDFRKRQRLVVEGDVRECTRDDAIALCSEINRTRVRGRRVSALPEDAFRRQQLEHERDE